jgi:hypothetical protein
LPDVIGSILAGTVRGNLSYCRRSSMSETFLLTQSLRDYI